MPERRTGPGGPNVLAVACITLLLANYFGSFADLDFAWQIRTGEQIVRHATLRPPEAFTYTIAGQSIPDFEWLYELILWAVWNGLGYGGLKLLGYPRVQALARHGRSQIDFSVKPRWKACHELPGKGFIRLLAAFRGVAGSEIHHVRPMRCVALDHAGEPLGIGRGTRLAIEHILVVAMLRDAFFDLRARVFTAEQHARLPLVRLG